MSVLQCKCSGELEEWERAGKKERGEKVTERGRQEGESGTQGREERDRHEVGARRGVEPETENISCEHPGVSVLVQSNSTSGSTGDHGEKLLG